MTNTASAITIDKISANVLKNALFNYFYKAKLPNTKQIPLDMLFENERRFSSVLHGLATSLGTQLWQTLATRIATEVGGFTKLDPKSLQQPAVAVEALEEIVQDWLAKRILKKANIELTEYIDVLKAAFPRPASSTQKYQPLDKSLGVDLLLTKDGEEWAIESKTCQINAGGGREFNEKLMRWYAYRYFQKGETCKFKAFLAIPYNPYPGDWFSAQAGRIYPLTKNDVWLQDIYWDFLSGEPKTWERILSGFEQVANSKPLMDLYHQAIQKNVTEDFDLQLLAQQIGCELVISKGNSHPSNPPRWKCYECESEFEARSNHLYPSHKDEKPIIAVCPICSKPFGGI